MEEECLDIGYKAAEAEAHKARIEWLYRRASDRSEGRSLKGSANAQTIRQCCQGYRLV